jgi:hypothetical protein
LLLGEIWAGNMKVKEEVGTGGDYGYSLLVLQYFSFSKAIIGWCTARLARCCGKGYSEKHRKKGTHLEALFYFQCIILIENLS